MKRGDKRGRSVSIILFVFVLVVYLGFFVDDVFCCSNLPKRIARVNQFVCPSLKAAFLKKP